MQHLKIRCSGLLLLIIAAATGCTRQLDRPSLKEINVVKVTGIDSIYYVTIGDTLSIRPQCTGGEGDLSDTNRYRKEWVNTNNDTTYRAPALELFIGKKTRISSTWYFRITDKQLGIFTQKKFLVSVTMPTQQGWYVLCDIGNNQPRLDMLCFNTGKEFSVAADVMRRVGSDYELKGKPLSVDFAHTLLAKPQVATIVVTDEDAVFLNPDWLAPVGKVSDAFPFSSHFRPSAFKASYSYYGAVIHAGDNLYISNFDIYGSAIGPMPRSATDPALLRISPLTACGLPSSMTYDADAVVFDVDNQSFFKMTNFAFGPPGTPIPMGKGPLFDFHIGKKLLSLTFTPYNDGEFYAILQDNNAATRYLAIFNIKGEQRYFDQLSATGIGDATMFAVSNEFGYLFYIVGNKVYEFDPINKSSSLVVDYGNQQISYMAAPVFRIPDIDTLEAALTNKLIIASYDAAAPAHSGVIDIYTVPPANGPLKTKDTYTGFGKVVAMSYRERTE